MLYCPFANISFLSHWPTQNESSSTAAAPDLQHYLSHYRTSCARLLSNLHAKSPALFVHSPTRPVSNRFLLPRGVLQGVHGSGPGGAGSVGVSHKPASPTAASGTNVALIAHMSRSNSSTALVEDTAAGKEEVKFQGRYVIPVFCAVLLHLH